MHLQVPLESFTVPDDMKALELISLEMLQTPK